MILRDHLPRRPLACPGGVTTLDEDEQIKEKKNQQTHVITVSRENL